MKKINYKLISIVVVSLIIGGVANFLYTSVQPKEKQKKAAAELTLSKTISTITVSGKVDSIEGKNITVNNLGDSITFSLEDNKPIYTLASEDGKQKKITFGEIKQGDVINASLKMSEAGKLTALSVIVFGQ